MWILPRSHVVEFYYDAIGENLGPTILVTVLLNIIVLNPNRINVDEKVLSMEYRS